MTLSPANATLGVGQTDRYKVTFPSGQGGGYTFSSSNTKVATVDNQGYVTGLSVGTATITVKTYNGKTAKSTLKVKKGPEFLLLNTYYEPVFDE